MNLPSPKRVVALNRTGIFATRDSGVHLLDVQQDHMTDLFDFIGLPDDVVETNTHFANGTDGDRAVFADGCGKFYKIDPDSNVCMLADLRRYLDDNALICGSIGADAKGEEIYFRILHREHHDSQLAHYSLLSGQLRLLGESFRGAFDINGRNGGLEAWADEDRLVVTRIQDGRTVAYGTQRTYHTVQISRDAGRVLLSDAGIAGLMEIVVLDSGASELLGPCGYNAAWCGSSNIVYYDERDTVCRYSLYTKEVLSIDNVTKDPGFVERPYGLPIASAAGSFIALGRICTSSNEGSGAPVARTILIDLLDASYRVVDGFWHNAAWIVHAEPSGP